MLLPQDLGDELRRVSAEEDRPMAYIVRRALQRYFAETRGGQGDEAEEEAVSA
jgi:hypothetical protein